MAIQFTVYGKPAPAGSKRGFPVRRKNGTIGVAMSDDSKRSKPWQAAVAAHGAHEMNGEPLFNEPISVEMIFYVARPKGHFGTGKNAGRVKPTAPAFPAVKPDVLKLARCVEDALTGVIWRDDAQIVREQLEKFYGEPESVWVRVHPMQDEG